MQIIFQVYEKGGYRYKLDIKYKFINDEIISESIEYISEVD